MAGYGRRKLIIIGILFHTIYLWSIFDIYFVSPLVHGMRHYLSSTEPPAKRVVLFVGDGLRADKAFLQLPDPDISNYDLFSDSSNLENNNGINNINNLGSNNNGSNIYLAPFLRSIVLNNGTFGVSHTRMPTESRPGHVALIAGFYEDVSAVTKGWKSNPVNFDSVFNQSTHTWSFGSPDILPMFSEGAYNPSHVETVMYPPDYEDFTKSSLELDEFVFKNVENLFKNATLDKKLNKRLHKNGIVFFLHLLGIDSAGHTKRPYSPEYYKNIKYVDAGVKKITNLINNFYNDDKTAFVFTADHGMSDWGSHGDGHPDNTRTPLIVWGAGVSKPVSLDNKDVNKYKNKNNLIFSGHDNYSTPWNLNNVSRNDVAQADIAPLMAYLAGLNYPANSVGKLPINYLSASPAQKAEALYSNAMEILEQYTVKENEVSSAQWNYKPYSLLSNNTFSYKSMVSQIQNLIADEEYDDAISSLDYLIKISLDGLNYLQKYNWFFLRSIVTAGYIGWIFYALSAFFALYVLPNSHLSTSKLTESSSPITKLIGVSVFAALSAILYQQKSPSKYYLYAFFPVYFWTSVLDHLSYLPDGLRTLAKNSKNPQNTITFTITNLVIILILLETVVFGYFDRRAFSVCFWIASLWPFVQNFTVAKENIKLSFAWVVCSLLMSFFTLLPANKAESLPLIVSGGILMLIVSATAVFYETSKPQNSNLYTRVLLWIQVSFIALTLIVTVWTIDDLTSGRGLKTGNKVLGWSCLILSTLVLPFLHAFNPKKYPQTYDFRLLILYLAFSPAFVILSISYECLFYTIFFATMIIWLELEALFYKSSEIKGLNVDTHDEKSQLSSKEKEEEEEEEEEEKNDIKNVSHKFKMSPRVVHIGLFFFFLAQVAFFGTGNVASISSFSLDSVLRLIPVFDPFAMGAMLLFKILVPFVIISGDLSVLNHKIGVPPSALFSMVLAIADIMTLNFFYFVKDEGSWLDIGTSISHFCIASLLCVFMIALEYIGDLVVAGVEIDES